MTTDTATTDTATTGGGTPSVRSSILVGFIAVALTACALPIGNASRDAATTVPTQTGKNATASTTEAPTTVQPVQTTSPAPRNDVDNSADTIPSADQAPTALPVQGCAAFEKLSVLDQMRGAANGEVTEVDTCTDAVEAAAAAGSVYLQAAELASTVGFGETAHSRNGGASTLVKDLRCDETAASAVIENPTQVPLLVWGALWPEVNKLNRAAQFVTAVLQPGKSETVSVEIPVSQAASEEPWCAVTVRPIIAPVGTAAADVSFANAAAESDQRSTVPQEWLGELQRVEGRAASGSSPDVYPMLIEDVHSPDLPIAIGEVTPPRRAPNADDGSRVRFGWLNATVPQAASEPICSADDVTEQRDDTGQLVLIRKVSRLNDGSYISLGLFRRGGDGVWRYAGRVAHLAPVDGDSDPCEQFTEL